MHYLFSVLKDRRSLCRASLTVLFFCSLLTKRQSPPQNPTPSAFQIQKTQRWIKPIRNADTKAVKCQCRTLLPFLPSLRLHGSDTLMNCASKLSKLLLLLQKPMSRTTEPRRSNDSALNCNLYSSDPLSASASSICASPTLCCLGRSVPERLWLAKPWGPLTSQFQ